ncbi:histidine phosphatase family protein [Pseudoruegeria sp. SK021]|uniref:histidine phosphatase family protein n=1 Tax=Pseudoruegeria sp. SK021 TaxID=1933035 RepID=UPI000A24ACD7|nr:histidine phosphatase family protein [Pseudoruegeria sp. SK021]OSP56140.1 hypothetical protein BV911_04180 [Pseudoruegeria sp. SK021]
MIVAAIFPELLVIRHGETEWNRRGRMQGTLDSPLTQAGRTQAAILGDLLRALEVSQTSHRAFSSPQPRARLTAEIALSAVGLVAVPDPSLREIDVGDWTGLDRAEIAGRWPAPVADEPLLDFYARAPGGETFPALWDRVGGFLDRLEGPCVVFTHGITSRVLRTRAMGLGLDDLAALPDGQGVIHRVRNGSHDTVMANSKS